MLNMKEYTTKILENIKKCSEQESLTVDEWVSLVESYRDIGSENIDTNLLVEVEQALMASNKRIKARILNGSDLYKMSKIENILGENRPTTPVISVSGTKGANLFVFINSIGTSDRYADSEITPVLDFDIVKGSISKDKVKIKLIEPTELTNSTRKVQISFVFDTTEEFTVGLYMQYVSPTGLRSERSNVVEIKVNFGYVGFIEDISANSSIRVGFNTIEDISWLNKMHNRFNEYKEDDPITKYLDNAEHLPFHHMKRYVLQCVRTPNADGVYEVRYHPTLNLADINDPNSEFVGFGDCDSFDHPKAKAFDSYTDQLMVAIVPHHQVDVIMRYENKEYYIRCCKNTEFTVDVRDFGFRNPEWVKGRGIVSDNNNKITSVPIEGFMIGAFADIYQNKNGKTYEGSFVVRSKPRTRTAVYNHRRDIQKYTGPGTDESKEPLFKPQNYFERRTVIFLLSIERGYVGNTADNNGMTTKWRCRAISGKEENILEEPWYGLPKGNRVINDTSYMFNYRGILNLSGNVWEWIDGIFYNSSYTNSYVWSVPDNKTPYSAQYSDQRPNPEHYKNMWPDYQFMRGRNDQHTYIWGKQLYPGELFADVSKGEASSTTGITDYYWFHNGSGGYAYNFCSMLVSGSVDYDVSVGFYTLYGYLSSYEGWAVGCRCVFRSYSTPGKGKVLATYTKGELDSDN